MTRRTFNDPGHAHFITFSCFHRQQFLTDAFACSALAEAINTARKRHTFALWAYVFMPEHVHLLIHPQLVEHKIGVILRDIKEYPARRVIQRWRDEAPWKLDAMLARQGQRIVHRFWQAGGGYDRNVFQTETLRKAVEYIEWNPVRRKLVSDPCDWIWSSAGARSGRIDIPLRIDPIEGTVV